MSPPDARVVFVMRGLSLLLVLLGFTTPATADKRPETWPKVVTQSWLGEFGKTRWPLAKLVDPDRGLVVIEHLVDSPSEAAVAVTTANRLCGAPLDKALPALQRRVLQLLAHSDTIECHNRPGPAACSFAFAYEYTTRTILVFRPGASGDLALDAVLFVDGGSLGESSIRTQQTFVRSKLAALRKADCAGHPDTPPSYEPVDER
jgi:hypothetical protein